MSRLVLANWSSVTTDSTTQTRTANQQNEITSISGQTTPGYDSNGNTPTDQSGHTLIYDAWNRLVQVKNGATVLQSELDGLKCCKASSSIHFIMLTPAAKVPPKGSGIPTKKNFDPKTVAEWQRHFWHDLNPYRSSS